MQSKCRDDAMVHRKSVVMGTMAADLSSSNTDDLEAWREVHEQLIQAVQVAREAVAAQKAQRRFWLEEICANLNNNGKLAVTSVWKRPQVPKKTAAKKTGAGKAAGTKRKKKEGADGKPAKKAKKKKEAEADDTGEATAPKKMKLKHLLPKKEEGEKEVEHSGYGASEYVQESASYPPPGDFGHQPPPHWGAAGNQNLQMMAAVAFGANPATSYQSLLQQQQQQAQQSHPYNAYFAAAASPPPLNPSVGMAQSQAAYPANASVRTYSSIQDVEDDESDQDRF